MPVKTRSSARTTVNRLLRTKLCDETRESPDGKVLFLGTKDDGGKLSLDHKYLKTHALAIAPTQHGKSTLKRRLFRGLAPLVKRGEATVFDSDPKGADHDGLVEDCAALGLEHMTYILNSSKRRHV